MKRLLWLILAFGFVLRTQAIEIISVDELRPGMKGYGLSVFQGYKVERFNVEIIDILPKALPKTDLILVKCSGAGLEKSRVIAGMSGSPVYFKGKLAGAIAYTWSFAQEPIAGVTPIERMLDLLKESPKNSFKAEPKVSKANSFQLKPAECPLVVAGASLGELNVISEILKPFEIGPVVAGSYTQEPSAPSQILPGSAIGVELVRGDINITAVGTATLVDGNTVLAFGHGFFEGGAVSFPLSLAKVHTVVASNYLSFKLASPVKELGALNRDTEVGIAGRLGEQAKLLPVKVKVKNRSLGIKESFSFEVADYPYLTPALVRICLYRAISSAGAISDRSTVKLNLEMGVEGYNQPVHYQDWFTVSGSAYSSHYLAPFFIVLQNPYKRVEVKYLNFDLDIKPGWEVAQIESVWANKMEVEPGETILLGIRFKVFQGEEFEKIIPFQVPLDAGRSISLRFFGGEIMPLDVAPPTSLDDLLKAFEKIPSPKWLVLRYSKRGLIYDREGKRLRDLPPSIRAIIGGKADTSTKKSPDYNYHIYPMPYIIRGSAGLRLRVKPPSIPKKR